jgi:hypothetical protein
MPVALDASEALDVLAAWAACGVGLVRDTGSAGGSVLQQDLVSGMPRVQAAGRFLAPAGRYFPALLPEAAPQEQLGCYPKTAPIAGIRAGTQRLKLLSVRELPLGRRPQLAEFAVPD